MHRTLKNFPLQKAPGPDGILNETLRYAPEECVEALAAVFQLYQLGYVPDEMLLSETVLLFKGGSKSQYDLKNFRPIALLPTVNKLYAGTLTHILQDYVES